MNEDNTKIIGGIPINLERLRGIYNDRKSKIESNWEDADIMSRTILVMRLGLCVQGIDDLRSKIQKYESAVTTGEISADLEAVRELYQETESLYELVDNVLKSKGGKK